MGTRILVLFAVALAARVVAAATSALYVDEAFGFFMSRHGFGDILVAARPDNNPPLWYFVMHPLALATHHGLLLRLPSCVLGALAAPLTYLVGRRFSEAAGLWSGTLVAVAYTSWLVDAQTRAYGAVTMLSVALLWTALESREDGSPPGGLPFMGAAALALPLLHFIGWLVDAALLLACLLPGTPRRAARAGCYAAGLLGGAAWMVYAATNPRSGLHARALANSGVSEASSLFSYVSGLMLPMHWPGVRPMGGAEAVTWTLALLAAGLTVWGAVTAWRSDRRAASTIVLFVAIPWAGIMAGALAGFQPYQNRYMVPISAGIYVLTAVGAARSLCGRVVLGLMLAANGATLALFPTDRFLHNQDWASAASWIERREQPGDAIAAYTPYSLVGLDFYYHAGQAEADFTTPGTIGFRYTRDYAGAAQYAVVPAMLDDGFAAQLGGRRVFLVLNQGDPGSRDAVVQWFEKRWQPADVYRAQTLAGWGDTIVVELVPK